MVSKTQILQVFPTAATTTLGIDAFVAALNKSIVPLLTSNNNFHNAQRVAAFLAQTAHESGSFTAFKESLYYSDPERICKIFRKAFDLDMDKVIDPEEIEFAKGYIKNSQKLANRAYANRMGNGDEASGDGYKYRGRGIIQCTGKDNYIECGKFLNLDLVNHPELLEQLPGAIDSAIWFWTKHDLNKYSDVEDIKGQTLVINGGYVGLDERLHNYKAFKAVLGI